MCRWLPKKTRANVRHQNGIDVFGIFFFWIGVVKAQMANAAIVTCQSEIDADAFGMSYVQVAVGLWGKRVRILAGSGLPLA